MKTSNLLIVAVFTSIFFFFSSIPTLAKDASVSSQIDFSDLKIDPGTLDVGDSLISPASPLYFLKAWRERIEIFMSEDRVVTAHRKLEFSVRRLREVKSLTEQKREDLIESTLERYRKHIDEIRNLIGKNEDFQMNFGKSIARHLYVLQILYYDTNDLNAKRAIRASMQQLERFNRDIIERMEDKDLKEQLIDSIALRQIAACQFLDLESSNAGLNESEREHLRDYVTGCQKSIQENFKSQLEQVKKSGTIPSR